MLHPRLVRKRDLASVSTVIELHSHAIRIHRKHGRENPLVARPTFDPSLYNAILARNPNTATTSESRLYDG